MRRPRCCYPARTAGYEIAVELDVLAVDVVPLDQRVQNGRCCICSLLSHSTTRTWASCQGVIPVWFVFVLLRRFLWHAEVRRSSVALFNTLTKQTQTLCVSSTRSHTPVPKRFFFISTSQVRQAFPSSQRLEACLNLRSRLAATAAGQVPRIDDSPSDDPGCFTSKVKRSYPGPWLANAASPIIR